MACDLAGLFPGTRETWLLVAVVLSALTLALFAFTFYRTSHAVIAAVLAVGALLFVAVTVVNLATLFPVGRVAWLLAASVLTAFTFALFAAASARTGHSVIAAFLAAGAWLFGAFSVLVWFWRKL